MIVIGIDPGQSGGLAVLDPDLGAFAYPMPMAGKAIDWMMVAEFLRRHVDGRDCIAFVEKVAAMPKQGVSSTFKFGVNAGGVHGVLGAMAIPMCLVRPQAWKQRVLKGTAKDKAAAVDFVRRRYPAVSLLATERSRRPHDGMADALCIATFGKAAENGGQA